MTKKMLVKTESVDMTWGRVLGSDGWGEGELVQRNQCEWIFPSKTFFFFFLLKCHLTPIQLTNTHTDKLENTQYSLLWYLRGETEELPTRNLWVIPGFLHFFPSLSLSLLRTSALPHLAKELTLCWAAETELKATSRFESCWKKLTQLHILWHALQSLLSVWLHDTLLHCLSLSNPTKMNREWDIAPACLDKMLDW